MSDHLTRHRSGPDDGFTLIELMVVIVLLGIAGTIFLSTVVSSTKVDSRTRNRADVQQSVAVSMQRMTKQLRVAAPLVSVADHSAVVDVYPTTAGTTRHRYTFTVASGQLTEQLQVFSPATAVSPTSTSTRVLARELQVTEPTFVPLDRAGSPTTVAAKVASVQVRLTGTGSPTSTLPVETDVFLRNYQG